MRAKNAATAYCQLLHARPDDHACALTRLAPNTATSAGKTISIRLASQ